MDQRAHEDIAAAAAAHHELGRDYDGAIAEGLVERIGEEIDKRVDARLGTRDRSPRRPAVPAQPDQHRTYWTGVVVGAAVTSVPAIIVGANGSFNPRALTLVMVGLWIAIAVAYLASTRARRLRDRE